MLNFNQKPVAYAIISGSEKYFNIKGRMDLYEVYGGTLVVVGIYGLDAEELEDNHGFFGFHVHEEGTCSGNKQDAFANTKGHYNPAKSEHSEHAGDLPPLLSKNGIAWMTVYTGRFYPEEVIGKTIVVHNMADDFRSQPSGNAGEKVACGEIRAWES